MKCPVCGNGIRDAVPVCPGCSYILSPSDGQDSLHQSLSFEDGTRGKQKTVKRMQIKPARRSYWGV